ncbi:MAG: DUF2293 domain-containing protein [Pseudomonadota bacterium]
MSRHDDFRKLINALCPLAPYIDAQAIIEAATQKDKKALPRGITLWLVVVAHVRHRHTDYEKLLADGYDRDSARHFTTDQINAVLRKWGCTRNVEEQD